MGYARNDFVVTLHLERADGYRSGPIYKDMLCGNAWTTQILRKPEGDLWLNACLEKLAARKCAAW
jgi:hypothetical protein